MLIVAGVHAVATAVTVPFLQGGHLTLDGAQLWAGAQVALAVGAMSMIAVVVDARRTATQRDLEHVVSQVDSGVDVVA